MSAINVCIKIKNGRVSGIVSTHANINIYIINADKQEIQEDLETDQVSNWKGMMGVINRKRNEFRAKKAIKERKL